MMTHSSQKWLKSGCWLWRLKCFSTFYRSQHQPCSDSTTGSAACLRLLWRSYEGHWCAFTYTFHAHIHLHGNETKQNKLFVFCSLMVLPALINQDSKKKKKSFQDIERYKQWGEMALGFPWQLLQAAKRTALKTYVRLDWYVHSEHGNRLCVQPITLSLGVHWSNIWLAVCQQPAVIQAKKSLNT